VRSTDGRINFDPTWLIFTFFDIDSRDPVFILGFGWQDDRVAQIVEAFTRIDVGLYEIPD
jgi:hypothetical protein